MEIPEELKNMIRNGDYTMIAEMYNERHERSEDYRTVSVQYVKMVLDGVRPVRPGLASEEILMIAIKYLEHRRNFIDELLIA